MLKVKSPIAYLRDVRRNLAIPQEELAKQIGISRASYIRKENGIKEFTLEEFTRMIVALHLDANDLALMFREVIRDEEIPVNLQQYKWDFSKPRSQWLDWHYKGKYEQKYKNEEEI